LPCPYAEKKGPVVYCKLIGKKVNPLAFPCLTNRYERCKYYRQRAQAAKPPASESTTPPQPSQQAAPQPPPPPATVRAGAPQARPAGQARGETKGLTLDGRRPSNCLECIYYGAKTKTCLLLGVTVEDPYDPPCAKM